MNETEKLFPQGTVSHDSENHAVPAASASQVIGSHATAQQATGVAAANSNATVPQGTGVAAANPNATVPQGTGVAAANSNATVPQGTGVAAANSNATVPQGTGVAAANSNATVPQGTGVAAANSNATVPQGTGVAAANSNATVPQGTGVAAANSNATVQQATGPQAQDPRGTATGSCPWQHIAPWQLLQPPKKSFRQRHPVLFWLGIPFLVFAVFGTVSVVMDDAEGLPAGDRLAMLRVEGAIMQNREILHWIDRLQRDTSVKGVLLRVDSPGGGAAASQELYAAIVRLREKKPVVAYMGTVAASGGLMVALAGNKVVANPSSVTGSIGVKMDLPQFHGLMNMLGVGRETLTTGAFKDAGSPFKPLSPDERTYLQGVLQDMHSQFVELVADARKLPMDKVQAIADGRIFTGREALKLNIVDALGGQDVALQLLREQTGIVSANLLEQPKKKIPWKDFIETMLDIDLGAQRQSAGFLYVY